MGKSLGWLAGCAIALGLAAPSVHAAGTAAGTQIQNTATLDFVADGRSGTRISATAPPVIVAKVLAVSVAWQDAAAIPATSPDTAKPLTFAITNTGNGPDTYVLDREDALGSDRFDPAPSPDGSIWIESGNQPGLQRSGPNADILYAPGVNDIAIPADATRIVYLSSAIPANVVAGSFGKSALNVASATPGAAGAAAGAAIGTSAGVVTVVGAGRGRGRAEGSYLVASASLGMVKTVAAVRDASGGTRVMPGSVLTYRLVLNLTGTGTADKVVLTDPLPSSVTYLPGSLTVDGAPRTDAADADEVGFNGQAVVADFGSLPVPATRVIEFKVTVN